MNDEQQIEQPNSPPDGLNYEQQTPNNKPRKNPRLVYNNPDIFFYDLLMEEEEQG